MEHALISNEVTNPISTSLPQQNIDFEIHDGEGQKEDVAHGAEQETRQGINLGYLPESRSEPLVTKELVGESFKRKFNVI